jgi:hypothetical protein
MVRELVAPFPVIWLAKENLQLAMLVCEGHFMPKLLQTSNHVESGNTITNGCVQVARNRRKTNIHNYLSGIMTTIDFKSIGPRCPKPKCKSDVTVSGKRAGEKVWVCLECGRKWKR